MKKRAWLVVMVMALVVCFATLTACNPKKEEQETPEPTRYYTPVEAFKNGDFETKRVKGDDETSLNDGHVTILKDWTFETEHEFNADGSQWADANAWVSDVNSGFEGGATMWVRTGSNSLKLEGSGDNTLAFTMTQGVDSLKAGTYALVFYIYADNADTTVKAANGTASVTSPVDYAWKKCTFDYELSADGKLTVGFDITSKGKAYIDSVGLYRVSDTQPAAADNVTLSAPVIKSFDVASRILTWEYVPYAEEYVVSVSKDGGTATEYAMKNDLTASKPVATNSFDFNEKVPDAGIGEYAVTVKALNKTDTYAINASAASVTTTITIKNVKSIDTGDLVYKTTVGTPIELPSMVDVTYEDGTFGQEPAQWYPQLVEGLYEEAKTYTVTGKVRAKMLTGVSDELSADIIVVDQLVTNGSFEDGTVGNLTGWTTSGLPDGVTDASTQYGLGDWGTGTGNVVHLIESKTETKQFTLTTKVEVEAGVAYEFKISYKFGANATLSFSIDGGTPVALAANNDFVTEVQKVDAFDTAGIIEIAITMTKPATEGWGCFDEVSFSKPASSNGASMVRPYFRVAAGVNAYAALKEGSTTAYTVDIPAALESSFLGWAVEQNYFKATFAAYSMQSYSYANNVLTVTVKSEDGTVTNVFTFDVNFVDDAQLLQNPYFFAWTTGWTVTLDGSTDISGIDGSGWGSPMDPCMVMNRDSTKEKNIHGKTVVFSQIVSVTDYAAGQKLVLAVCANGSAGNEIDCTLGEDGEATFALNGSGFGVQTLEYLLTEDDITAGTVTLTVTVVPKTEKVYAEDGETVVEDNWGLAISYITLTAVA